MNRFFTAFLLIALFAVGAFAADFTAALEKVAGYDFGDSRESLLELSALLRASAADKAKMIEYENAMLKVLKDKKSSFAAKQYLCKELSIMGGDASVPTLAKMLRTKETADIARYALERIPGETVDEALIKALKKSKGTSKIGVMNTLGNRGTASAAYALKKVLDDKNPVVAGAAASALGRIGTHETATILGDALQTAQDPLRAAIVEAYLDNAVAFVAAGEKNNAQSIYQILFDKKETLPTRTASLTGLVRTVEEPTTFIVNVLENEDMEEGLKAAAISSVHQCKRSLDAAAISATLPTLTNVSKVQLLTALRERGDAAAHDAVAAQLSNDDLDVSVAAISALAVLGDKSDVMLLANTAATSAGDIQEEARTSLALLNAPGVDETILTALPKADAKIKVELVQAIGERQMKTSVPTLLNAATDENARVRVAALKSLGQVAAQDDMDALVALLINAKANAERREAERTVVAVATKIDAPDQRGTAILKALPGVEDMTAKSSLLLVLGRIGVSDALPILKEGLTSDDAEMKRAAILSLSEWPTPDPADDLLNVAKTAEEASHKVLGLRGYIKLAGLESDRPKVETVAMYKTALDIAQDAGEKRRALSGLARVECLEALLLAGEYLDDADLKGEAEIAVMDNAWRTRSDKDKTPERKAILQKVYEQTTDDESKRDAKRLVDEYK